MNTEITSFNSTFFEYLCGFIWFDQDKLEALMKRYPIGATEEGESIFCTSMQRTRLLMVTSSQWIAKQARSMMTVGTIKMGDRLACLVSTYLVPSPARRLHW